MESKISEANSHDEIFISVGVIPVMAISSGLIEFYFVWNSFVIGIHYFR